MNGRWESLAGELDRFFSGEAAAVVGVGNTDRGDDGFGPAVVALLRGMNAGGEVGTGPEVGAGAQLLLIDAGIRPENCLDAVAEAGVRKVLFVDAAGGEGGGDEEGGGAGPEGRPSLELRDPSELVGTSVSTHRLPLALVAELLRAETGAEVKVLAYHVSGDGRLERFGRLSAGARQAAPEAAAAIRDARRGKSHRA